MERHWSDQLVTRFPAGRETELTFKINPDEMTDAMVLVMSRMPGLKAALGPAGDPDGPDLLEREDPDDLYQLLVHLHRVRVALQGQEERVMLAAKKAGLRYMDMASALGYRSKQSISNRIAKIKRAGQMGLSAAALDQMDEDDLNSL